jgi:hypothetical protein
MHWILHWFDAPPTDKPWPTFIPACRRHWNTTVRLPAHLLQRWNNGVVVIELSGPCRAHGQGSWVRCWMLTRGNATMTGSMECCSCHRPPRVVRPTCLLLVWNGGLSFGITGVAHQLSAQHLHLDCCVASLWPTSPALLLFVLLMVATVRPQVRPIPRCALHSCVNAIFATGHQECWVYCPLVNIYALSCITNAFVLFSVYSLYTLTIIFYSPEQFDGPFVRRFWS